ncbi:MAG TPA: S9 family peptidase [Gemmatimonadales bacterium]|nr:S9 family peptidase [Gemmatimonadales bacterium]
MRAAPWIVLTLSALLGSPVLAQGRRVELNDLGRQVNVVNPRLSPDGKSAIIVLVRTNYAENRFERSLSIVDIGSGSMRALTPGRRNVSGAEWSPDGQSVSFMDREDDKPAQLYVLPVAGGEARKVTDVKSGISGYAWRPDGKAFAFLTDDVPPEATGEDKFNKSFEVHDNMYLDRQATQPTHVWTIALEGGTATRVTSGVRTVTDVRWTLDGKRLVLAVRPRPESGELIRQGLVIRDVASGAERALTETLGVASGGLLSPDGKTVAFARSRGKELYFHPDGIFVTSLDGGTERDASVGIDRDPGSMQWLADGSGLVVVAPDSTRSRAWVQPLSGAPRRLNWGDIDAGEINVGATGAILVTGRQVQRPPELYYLASINATPRRLTDVNAELAATASSRSETITWQGPDGFTQNGVVTYPPDYTAGRKYPLVLEIHGGPMGTSTDGWNTSHQVMAAQGWIIFSPNYRGSNNMGDRFQSAVINDAGDGPGRDVMSGIEELKRRGMIDETRMAVSGWSYGGYMTAWLTAHYQGWKAAVAGAAVTDWFDWYNMADMNTWSGFGLGGSPWTNGNAMNYWKQSPMAYAHQIKTPTLILSTTGDPRVTVTQSYKLYHALKDNGTTVQFIAYPVGGHFPPDPVHQRDVYKRWIDWIAKHFGQTP